MTTPIQTVEIRVSGNVNQATQAMDRVRASTATMTTGTAKASASLKQLQKAGSGVGIALRAAGVQTLGMASGVGTLLGALNPLTLVVVGLSAVLATFIGRQRKAKEATEEARKQIAAQADELERLRLGAEAFGIAESRREELKLSNEVREAEEKLAKARQLAARLAAGIADPARRREVVQEQTKAEREALNALLHRLGVQRAITKELETQGRTKRGESAQREREQRAREQQRAEEAFAKFTGQQQDAVRVLRALDPELEAVRVRFENLRGQADDLAQAAGTSAEAMRQNLDAQEQLTIAQLDATRAQEAFTDAARIADRATQEADQLRGEMANRQRQAVEQFVGRVVQIAPELGAFGQVLAVAITVADAVRQAQELSALSTQAKIAADLEATAAIAALAASATVAAAQLNALSLAGLPKFQTGGVVPGPMGRPQLAVVHGGEEIIPVGRGGGDTFNIAPRFELHAIDDVDAERFIQRMGPVIARRIAGEVERSSGLRRSFRRR